MHHTTQTTNLSYGHARAHLAQLKQLESTRTQVKLFVGYLLVTFLFAIPAMVSLNLFLLVLSIKEAQSLY